jgi:hypothetical protein
MLRQWLEQRALIVRRGHGEGFEFIFYPKFLRQRCT